MLCGTDFRLSLSARIEHMFGDKNVGAEVADRTCFIAGCGRKYVARGSCGMHYQRWSTTGRLGQQI
jgi:hypothetical protein